MGVFDGIVQWPTQLGGQQVKVPVFYRDLSALTVLWTASAKEVAARLPHPDMHPLELYPGKAVVGLTVFEYRDSDIGPYNELGIAFPISIGHRQLTALSMLNALREHKLPLYVWQLPVTTELARAGGVELYGLPKFLADIKLEQKAGEIQCSLSAEGKPILNFATPVPPPAKAQRWGMSIYSMKDGQPVVANVLIDALEAGEALGAAARIELFDGPIGEALRAMDVSGRAVAALWAPRAQAVLFGPRNLADV